MRHGYTAHEQSRAAFILRRDIRKAHIDVRFNARVAADCWRLIDAIENGEVDIDPISGAATASRGGAVTRPRANGKRKSLDFQSSPTKRAAVQRGKKRKSE
jgi:hypothetical protein